MLLPLSRKNFWPIEQLLRYKIIKIIKLQSLLSLIAILQKTSKPVGRTKWILQSS